MNLKKTRIFPMFFPCLSMRFSWLSHSFLYDLHMLFSCVFLYLFLMLFLCCSRALRAHSHACARVVCLCFFFQKFLRRMCFSGVFLVCFIWCSSACLMCVSCSFSCVAYVFLKLFFCCSHVFLYVSRVFSCLFIFVDVVSNVFFCDFICVYVCSLANSPFPCFS